MKRILTRNPNPAISPKMRKFYKSRTRIYIAIIAVLICSQATMTAFASLFDYEIPDLYRNITLNIHEINRLLRSAFDFAMTSPFDVVNSIQDSSPSGVVLQNIIRASKTTALTVAAFLLFVDFFRKSVNFEWSSKWENILLFLIKIIVLKVVIENADVIMGYIYAVFNYVNRTATAAARPEFLPCSNYGMWTVTRAYRGDNMLEHAFSVFWHEDLSYSYNISRDAVHIFYPNALFPTATSGDNVIFENPIDSATFSPIGEMVLLQPYFLILKLIAIIIFVITIGRVFELALYTIFAPLPLSTFASEGNHDVAKNFIKNYIATVLQVGIIVAMFMIHNAINTYFSSGFDNIRWIRFVQLGVLALSICKSGTWSRKICGLA